MSLVSQNEAFDLAQLDPVKDAGLIALCREFFPSQDTFDYMGHATPLEDLVALKSLTEQAPTIGLAKPVVEVGSWAGLTAKAILRGNPTHLFCIDHWKGTYGELQRYGNDGGFPTFCLNMGDEIFKRVVPLVGTSEKYSLVWPDNSLSMVFIDADHSYDAVWSDIQAWWPKLIDDGILCGHDYGMIADPGVQQAVDELFPDAQRFGRCVWAVRKHGELCKSK